MKRVSLLLAAMLMALSLTACAPERDAVKNSVNNAKNSVENGMNDMENAVQNGMDDAKDEMDDMIDDAKGHDRDGDLTDGENPQSKP